VAKGREKHQSYLDALNLLGKDLARRAKSKCELSQEPGTLQIFDLQGPDVEPDLDHLVMVCPQVTQHLDGKEIERTSVHYLETAVWSTQIAVRKAAIRILEHINEGWAHEAIENAKSMGE